MGVGRGTWLGLGKGASAAFSIEVDPTKLSIDGTSGFGNPNVTKAAGASPNEVIGGNATDAANGNLGLLVDFTNGTANTIPQGTRQIVNLIFTVNPGATGVTPITITGAPVADSTVANNGAPVHVPA